MASPLEHKALGPLEIADAFEVAGVGLCISRERVIQHCNQDFAAMFGYAVHELVGRSLVCLYPSTAESETIASRGLSAMRRTGRYSDERIMMRRNGKLFWCHVVGRSSNLKDPFSSAVWAFEDISIKRPVNVALTAREREMVQLLIVGKTSKMIARELSLSVRTVDSYRANLIKKFNVKSVVELVAKVVGLS